MIDYEVYGLRFRCPSAVPHLFEAPSGEGWPIEVKLGSVPERLENPQCDGQFIQAGPEGYLFRMNQVPRLLVQGGALILAQANHSFSPEAYWNHIFTVGGSIAAFQRGHFPLHASSITLDGAAIAFAGDSGAGKSTLVASLSRRDGFALLTDDLCVVRTMEGNQVGSGAPDVRLLPDAVETLALDPADALDMPNRAGKRVFRLARPALAEAPLKRLYILAYEAPQASARIERLSPIEAMQAIVANSRLGMRIDAVPRADRERAFASVASVARSIKCFRFNRARDPALMDQSLDALVRHMRKNIE